MPRLLLLFALALISLPSLAAQPAQVMLIGTFHFQDAGRDLVKNEDVDIYTEANQAYLEALTHRLQDFRPTRVLLEYAPENDELINERYREYLAGNYELGGNEIYQLGFRIAKLAGHDRVYSFDYREIEWEAEAMFEYAKRHDAPQMKAMNETIEAHTAEEAQARATMSLKELLQRQNDPEHERRNMDLYLATNSIGAGDGYAGAASSASWWERNFYMYANIQKLAEPDERIIAIGGSGHMAILKQLLAIDGRLQGVAVDSYF